MLKNTFVCVSQEGFLFSATCSGAASMTVMNQVLSPIRITRYDWQTHVRTLAKANVKTMRCFCFPVAVVYFL